MNNNFIKIHTIFVYYFSLLQITFQLSFANYFYNFRRNYRETWTLNVTEPVSGNYYPVNSRIFIRVSIELLIKQKLILLYFFNIEMFLKNFI